MAAIERRGNGYRVRIRRQGFPPLTKTFSSRKTAEAWARKTESEIERNVFLDTSTAKTLTLSDVLDRYEAEVLPNKKGKNRELSRVSLLRDSVGSIRLDLLRAHHIVYFRDQRLRIVKPATVHRDLSVLSYVLTLTIKDWGITLPQGNPMRQVRMPKIHGSRTRRISHKELSALLHALRSTPMVQDIVLLALETGMRRSEITSIRASHIQFNRRLLELHNTKNGHNRTIPLSETALTIVSKYPKGFDIRPDSITQSFARACKRARLNDLRFHDLRHEATSRFFEKGFNHVEVATITGHKDLRMLMRYTHLRPEDLLARLD